MKRLICALFVCSLFLGGCCHHKCVQKEARPEYQEAPQEHRDILQKMHDGVMKIDTSFRENAW